MAIKFLNTVQVDTDVLYVDAANDRVGIGTNTPSIYHILDVNGHANFSSDISVGRNATALSFDMNPSFTSGNYYLSLHKNQANGGGILLKSKPASGSAQLDWQIVNEGTTGDLKFYAYGLADYAFVLDRETGNLQLPEYGAGTLVSDASGNITVSSGGGAGGPYLPLSAGSSYPLTGRLDLTSAGGTGIRIVTGDTSEGYLIFGDAADNSMGGIAYNNNTNTLSIDCNNSERITILSNGNVGIGTTGPNANLDVQSATGTLRLGNNIGSVVTGAVVGKIEFSNVDTSLGAGVQAYIQSRAIDNGATYALDFFTGTKDNPTQTKLSLYNGNVGIGTTTPSQKLHVNAGTTNTVALFESTDATSRIVLKDNSGEGHVAAIGDNITFATSSSGSERMRITSGGKVGIGTTNPQDALDIDWDTQDVATDNSGIRVRAYRPHLNLIDRSGYGASNGHNFQIKADFAKLQFNATSADNETFDLTRMVIDKDGNVGIGTDDPDEKLEIAGSLLLANNSDIKFNNSAGNKISTIRYNSSNQLIIANGNSPNGDIHFQSDVTSGLMMILDGATDYVGIGNNTSPKSMLDVQGGIKMADDTDTASADKVGTLKYRVSGNNSYVDMCMQTGATTYAWINIVQNNW